ncbi:MAG: beta-lactamase family protein [Clostridia bacterium]|nr:beta-lactamase family protein [Clostridia bacterium]
MNFDKVSELLDRLADSTLRCCGLSVTLDGKPVYERYSGFSDEGKTRRAAPDDRYWIYSATKVITCVAAMRLLEEGKISLDDPVSKYFPEYLDQKVADPKTKEVRPAAGPMKVIHLFTMTGGLSYDLKTPEILLAAQMPGASTLDIVGAVGKTPLLFDPGTRYKYSLCHDVLAGIVELVSGMPFGEYCEKNIFKPLGMEHTTFHPSESDMSRMADQYRFRLADGTSRSVGKNNTFFITPDYESGGATCCSTVDDYSRLTAALSCGGKSDGVRILKEETVEMMEVNRLCDAALADFVTGRLYGYGWGLCGRVHINPEYSLSRSAAGEFGWDGAAGAFALADRRNRVGYYFGTHMLGCTYLYHWVHPLLRNMIYEALDG